MKRKRHTPEQIVRKLREGDRLLNEGTDLAEVLGHLGVGVVLGALARAVRRHEGRRGEAAQGARA
jgi:hypothetical protein